MYLRFRFNGEGSGSEVGFVHFIVKASVLVILFKDRAARINSLISQFP